MSEAEQLEIERKYLLSGIPPIPPDAERLRFEQGYLARARDAVNGRLRRIEHADGRVRYLHTIKRGSGLVRRETERDIDAAEFDALWPRTAGARLTKTRYCAPHDGLVWEVDVFDDLDLVLAEVELPAPDAPAIPPPWLAGYIVREVTGKKAYGNFRLARDIADG